MNVACSTLLTLSGRANASVAGTVVAADADCQAIELTKIIDGHDHMFVDPTVDNHHCWYNIEDAKDRLRTSRRLLRETSRPPTVCTTAPADASMSW